MKNDRDSYYSLPFSERAHIVKSLLYLIYSNAHQKKKNSVGSQIINQNVSSTLADFLDLKPYMVDEVIQRLIYHGYLSGQKPEHKWSFVSSVSLSPDGQKFFDANYGTTGDVYNIAPWGLVVNKSTMTNSRVGNSANQDREIVINDKESAKSAEEWDA